MKVELYSRTMDSDDYFNQQFNCVPMRRNRYNTINFGNDKYNFNATLTNVGIAVTGALVGVAAYVAGSYLYNKYHK